jgi:hypothetical protein
VKKVKLTNIQLQNFINKIKLREESMSQYREQMNNLKKKLGDKINNDDKTGVKVTKFIISGSWKKRTILRATGLINYILLFQISASRFGV